MLNAFRFKGRMHRANYLLRGVYLTDLSPDQTASLSNHYPSLIIYTLFPSMSRM